jgi:hypothetical protein
LYLWLVRIDAIPSVVRPIALFATIMANIVFWSTVVALIPPIIAKLLRRE